MRRTEDWGGDWVREGLQCWCSVTGKQGEEEEGWGPFAFIWHFVVSTYGVTWPGWKRKPFNPFYFQSNSGWSQHSSLASHTFLNYDWWSTFYLSPVFCSVGWRATSKSISLSTLLDAQGKQQTTATADTLGIHFCLSWAFGPYWRMTFLSHCDLCCWENTLSIPRSLLLAAVILFLAPIHGNSPDSIFPATKHFLHNNFLKFIRH